jgi:hypothetical protein
LILAGRNGNDKTLESTIKSLFSKYISFNELKPKIKRTSNLYLFKPSTISNLYLFKPSTISN